MDKTILTKAGVLVALIAASVVLALKGLIDAQGALYADAAAAGAFMVGMGIHGGAGLVASVMEKSGSDALKQLATIMKEEASATTPEAPKQ